MKITEEFKEIIKGFKISISFLNKKENIILILSTIIMLVVGILTNLPAIILGEFVDKIINLDETNFSIAIPFIAVIVIIIVVKEILNVIRKYFVENIVTQVEKNVTLLTISTLLKTDITDFINKYQIGALHGRIFRSINGLTRLIKLCFLDFFPTFFIALSAIIIAFFQKPILATFMILVIPVGFFIVVKQVASQKGIRVSLLRGKEKIDGKVVEMIGGLETIRVSNTVDYEIDKIKNLTERLRKIEIKHHIYMALYDAAKYLNEAFFYVLVISISIYFAVKGIITKGDILTYSILFNSIISPLRVIHRILDESHESSIKVKDLKEILDQKKDISFDNKNVKHLSLDKDKNLAISVKGLSFSYSGVQILNNINLDIKSGEKIGIAGVSGYGKSTFIKILLRLLHNYSGNIKLYGNNLETISRENIAGIIAYIPQFTYIFSGTIRENILYGNKDKIDDEKIIEVLKLANIYEEVKNNLGGLNGKVFENGKNLSGGQKQRLALARIILKNPEILIFDEATSALDNKNEIIIQKNIESFFKNKTIITIAHRLTTLKNSDTIIVFDKGKIVQKGNFDNLSKEDGLFKVFLEQKDF